jgi:hypothetical protein
MLHENSTAITGSISVRQVTGTISENENQCDSLESAVLGFTTPKF